MYVILVSEKIGDLRPSARCNTLHYYYYYYQKIIILLLNSTTIIEIKSMKNYLCYIIITFVTSPCNNNNNIASEIVKMQFLFVAR